MRSGRLPGLEIFLHYPFAGTSEGVLCVAQRVLRPADILPDGQAGEALEQIEDRQYALPFASDPRRLFKIGVNFSSRTLLLQDTQHRKVGDTVRTVIKVRIPNI